MTIGQTIYNTRVKCGMTQQTLSILTGLSERFINYIEKDKKRPSLRSLTKFADAFEMNMIVHYSPGEKVVKVSFRLRDTVISKSFEERVTLFRDRLLIDCLKLCRYNRQNAEDLVQDTLIEAYLHANRYNESSQLYTWLFGIAKNKYSNRQRNDKDITFVNEFIETGEKIEEVEQQPKLRKYVYRLSGRAKDIYRMRLLNYSYSEIGSKLGIKETSAKAWYWRINKDLKSRINES